MPHHCDTCDVTYQPKDWRDHIHPRDDTRLGRSLAELEAVDPDVAAAGRRLDEVIRDTSHRTWRADLVRDLYADSRGDA